MFPLITIYFISVVNHIELLGRVGAEPRKIGVNEAVAFPLFTETSAKLKDGTSKFLLPTHLDMGLHMV